MKPLVIAAVFTGTLASTAAIAQTETLPLQSPAESQWQQTNRSLQREDQQIQRNEQTQFDNNQLRLQEQQIRPNIATERGFRR